MPLMQGGCEQATVTRWQELAQNDTDELRRKTTAGLALVFAELTGSVEVWKGVLEDWGVRKSILMEEMRNEGRQEAARQTLLRVLQVRFTPEVPTELRERVAKEQDLARLSRWFDLALTASSLDAFTAGLDG